MVGREPGSDSRSRRLSATSIRYLRSFVGRTIPESYQRQLRSGDLSGFLSWAESVTKRYGIRRARMDMLERQLNEQNVNRDQIRTIRRWWEDQFAQGSGSGSGLSSDSIAALAEFAGVRRDRLPFSVERELQESGRLDRFLTWLGDDLKASRGRSVNGTWSVHLPSPL